VHTITGVPVPQGVAYSSETNKLFVGSDEGKLYIYDGTKFDLITSIEFGDDVDNLRYDSSEKRVYVGFGDGDTAAIAIVDAVSNKRLAEEYKVGAHPESFQLEKTGTRAFVNVPDRKEIQVVDLAKNALVAKWPVTSALRNYPMALDEAHHRLLVGCRAPARLLAIDTETGKQTASVEIVGDTDDLFYDAAKRRVYVIGGGGFVDVFDQKDADHYVRTEHVATTAGARTGYFVGDWGKLFVAVPHRGAQSAEVLVFTVL